MSLASIVSSSLGEVSGVIGKKLDNSVKARIQTESFPILYHNRPDTVNFESIQG